MCSSQQKIAAEKKKQPSQRRHLIPRGEKKITKPKQHRSSSSVYPARKLHVLRRTLGGVVTVGAVAPFVWKAAVFQTISKRNGMNNLFRSKILQLQTTCACSVASYKKEKEKKNLVSCGQSTSSAASVGKEPLFYSSSTRCVGVIRVCWWKSHAPTYPRVACDLFSRCVTSIGAAGGRQSGLRLVSAERAKETAEIRRQYTKRLKD